MQLRETRGEFAKGCLAQYLLPKHARSDHVLKPGYLFCAAGSVAGHQSLTVPDIVIRSLQGWVPINPVGQILRLCSHGPSESRRLSGHGRERGASRHLSLNFGSPSFGWLKTFGNGRFSFGHIRVRFAVLKRTGRSIRHRIVFKEGLKVLEVGWECAGAQGEWIILGCDGGSRCVEQCTLGRQIYNSQS